jgi:pimeloyl-ACP methyl ester carboxylesterase
MSTWILLRGLTRETRHWDSLPARLADEAGGARVLPIDLPGNGEFARLRASADVAGMVGFVRSAAVQLAGAGPYRVLAMSLGGMVATAWAQAHPADIERLVLINTSMRPFSRWRQRLRPTAWPDLLRIAARWREPHAVEAIVHRLTCNDRRRLDDDVAQWAAIRASAPVSRGNALRQLWAAARFRARRPAPRCPVLILSAAADQLVDPVCSAQLAAAWNAPHRRHPDAGHDLPHDDPEWILDELRAWLSQADVNAPM